MARIGEKRIAMARIFSARSRRVQSLASAVAEPAAAASSNKWLAADAANELGDRSAPCRCTSAAHHGDIPIGAASSRASRRSSSHEPRHRHRHDIAVLSLGIVSTRTIPRSRSSCTAPVVTRRAHCNALTARAARVTHARARRDGAHASRHVTAEARAASRVVIHRHAWRPE